MILIETSDAEQAVIDELTPCGFIVGTALPDPLPAAFLRVVTTGGSQRDLVTDSPTLVIESFAFTETAARANAVRAIAIIEAAVRENRLGSEVAYRLQTISLPQNFPLPSVPSHFRYISTIAPDVRRRVTAI